MAEDQPFTMNTPLLPAGPRPTGDGMLISSALSSDTADLSTSPDLPIGFAHNNLPLGAVPLERGIPAWRQLWRRSPLIVVYDATGFRIVSIPLEFLRANSLDRDWSHINNILGFCMETATGSLHSLRRKSTVPVNPSHPPLSGNYVFIRQDHSDANTVPCVPAVGPHGKRLGRQPGTDDQSSVSGSSRTSRSGQSKFREALIRRDSYCLATGKETHKNKAAHIVPVSRLDLYRALLGQEVSQFFEPSMGLLLDPGLHKSFDDLEWAFYPHETGLLLHVFNTDDVDIAKLHGKVVPYAWFRTQSSANWPDERLLRFQYKQCVQMFFRNYAFGVSAADATQRIASEALARAGKSVQSG